MDTLKNDFGVLPTKPDEKGDWERVLEEDTPMEFYLIFVEYAIRMYRLRL
jgi:hypothetical protein